MNGSVWQRCTRCLRRINGAEPTAAHRASGCTGTGASWCFKVTIGTGPKRRQTLRAGFRTQAEAQRALRDMMAKVDEGRYVEPSDQTVGSYLSGVWLPAIESRVTFKTIAKRRQQVDTYINPRIGDVPLQTVSAAHLDAAYGDLMRRGGRPKAGERRGRPLSASTVRDVHRTLSKAFGDAVRWQIIERNPCATADPPSIQQVTATARSARRAWEKDDFDTVMASLDGHPLRVVFHLAATTGLRRSELLALHWQDVHLRGDDPHVRVSHKMVQGPEGWRIERATKTADSARKVGLGRTAVRLLTEHRAGTVTSLTGLVFIREDGLPFNPPAVSIAWRRAAQAAKVAPIRLHDLRHRYATTLIARGRPVQEVAHILGHANAGFTLQTYGGVSPTAHRDAAAAIEDDVYGEAAGISRVSRTGSEMP